MERRLGEVTERGRRKMEARHDRELTSLSVFFRRPLLFPSLHLFKVKVNLDLGHLQIKRAFLRWNTPKQSVF